MSRKYPMFGLRIPPELRHALETAAAESGRSLNAEVTHRLYRGFESHALRDWQARRIADLQEVLSRVLDYADAAKSDEQSPSADSERQAFWDAIEELEWEARKLERKPSLGELYPDMLASQEDEQAKPEATGKMQSKHPGSRRTKNK